MEYKNTIRKYESESVIQEVREWVPSDVESEKKSVPEKKKEYAKAQIETITEEAETISEHAPQNLEQTEDYFIVYSGKDIYKLQKNVQKFYNFYQFINNFIGRYLMYCNTQCCPYKIFK